MFFQVFAALSSHAFFFNSLPHLSDGPLHPYRIFKPRTRVLPHALYAYARSLCRPHRRDVCLRNRSQPARTPHAPLPNAPTSLTSQLCAPLAASAFATTANPTHVGNCAGSATPTTIAVGANVNSSTRFRSPGHLFGQVVMGKSGQSWGNCEKSGQKLDAADHACIRHSHSRRHVESNGVRSRGSPDTLGKIGENRSRNSMSPIMQTSDTRTTEDTLNPMA